MHLALWLKKNRYRADQVQTFLPSPMATATAMYHTEVNPLRGVRRGASDKVEAIKGCGSADCTRRSCVITTQTTGRRCARPCATWAAPI